MAPVISLSVQNFFPCEYENIRIMRFNSHQFCMPVVEISKSMTYQTWTTEIRDYNPRVINKLLVILFGISFIIHLNYIFIVDEIRSLH